MVRLQAYNEVTIVVEKSSAYCPGCDEPIDSAATMCLECGYEPGVSGPRKVIAYAAPGFSPLSQWLLVLGQVAALFGAGEVALTTISKALERWVLIEVGGGVTSVVIFLALAIVFSRVRNL